MALLSLSFLSINRPTLSSVEAGLHIPDGESSGMLDNRGAKKGSITIDQKVKIKKIYG